MDSGREPHVGKRIRRGAAGVALSESRVIITHNRTDFENLARAWWGQQRDHAGLLLAVRRVDTYDLARHVLPVLQLYDQTGWRNTVLYA
jgi:hypothetical protein